MNENWQPFKKFIVNPDKPKATYTLLIITGAIFVLDQVSALLLAGRLGPGYLSLLGMKINTLIRVGQWWRLVGAVFLHADLSHIAFNMLALYIWGRYVEALYGRTRYVTLYLLAGIMGTAASFALTSARSLGASGAVFGLFGALLYFRKYDKRLFNFIFGIQVLVFLGISLFSGFAQPLVDNMGHIGGLLGGYLAARVVGLLSEKDTERKVLLNALIYLGCLAAFMVVGYIR